MLTPPNRYTTWPTASTITSRLPRSLPSRTASMLVGNPSFRTKAGSRSSASLPTPASRTRVRGSPRQWISPRNHAHTASWRTCAFQPAGMVRTLTALITRIMWRIPKSGTFEGGGPCPVSHPVRVPQLMYEVIFDTRQFNNKDDWPLGDGQPFFWSQDDRYATSSLQIPVVIYSFLCLVSLF